MPNDDGDERDFLVHLTQQAVKTLAGKSPEFSGILTKGETEKSWLDATVIWTQRKTPKESDDVGKPWNMEIRTATSFFNRFKKNGVLCLISPWGVERTFSSAVELARALLPELEQALSDARNDTLRKSVNKETCKKDHDVVDSPSYHIGVHPKSGILCVATPARVHFLRQHTRLQPCPYCPEWCKGGQGLRWHIHQHHGTTYDQAKHDSRENLPDQWLVVYDSSQKKNLVSDNDRRVKNDENGRCGVSCQREMSNDPWECVKQGNLSELQNFIERNHFDPVTALDSKGASALLWAAGSGHMQMVRFLVEDMCCDVDFAQCGRRSFGGRTALHWACRNGHSPIVRYLLSRGVDIQATTMDGSSAFHWAAWQHHDEVLNVLVNACRCEEERHQMVSHVNNYGCNAVLWAAQGQGSVCTLQWLDGVAGCPIFVVNHSGHGVLHKAAQRGGADVCEWFVERIRNRILTATDKEPVLSVLDLLGPDNDGCLSSDLAGMEDHADLATFLANMEVEILCCAQEQWSILPEWLNKSSISSSTSVWEPWAGVARLRHAFVLKS